MFLAFYKAHGTLADRLVRWWTRSPYSHVEVVIDGIWYSASPREGEVRSKAMPMSWDRWDFVRINATPSQKRHIRDLFESQMGKHYDWLGIVMTQIIPLGIQNPSRWFCSEICAAVLHDSGAAPLSAMPAWYSPGRLYE
ncbi:MAG: hypothetical protein DRI61_04125, partial [Chloroflexi bacterium]